MRRHMLAEYWRAHKDQETPAQITKTMMKVLGMPRTTCFKLIARLEAGEDVTEPITRDRLGKLTEAEANNIARDVDHNNLSIRGAAFKHGVGRGIIERLLKKVRTVPFRNGKCRGSSPKRRSR